MPWLKSKSRISERVVSFCKDAPEGEDWMKVEVGVHLGNSHPVGRSICDTLVTIYPHNPVSGQIVVPHIFRKQFVFQVLGLG